MKEYRWNGQILQETKSETKSKLQQSWNQPWQERCFAEYMTHALLGSLNSVGGIATEINAVNYVSPKSWLATSHAVESILNINFEGFNQP